MKNHRQYLIISSAVLLMIFGIFGLALAANPPAGGGVSIPNPIGAGDFPALVDRIAGYLFTVGIPIAVIMILWSAYMFMTSSGEAEKVTSARKALTYALIGIAVLLLSKGLTSLVAELLGSK